MRVSELLRWQWKGYPRYHRSRVNLLVHIGAVPLFLVGNVGVVLSLSRGAWLLSLVWAAAVVVSLALQGRGHRLEALPPEPFTSPLNALSRIFCEQWVTFPRFVLSGGWLGALRNASPR